jgi:NADH dehydrogenase [ubiquinone] 1 alpha subcomplex assembly factor 5
MVERISQLIDAIAHRRYRDRAASGFGAVNFLKQAAADRLADRLDIVRRHFPLVLDIGSHHGEMAKAALASGKVDRVICADPSLGMVSHTASDMPSCVVDYDNINFSDGAFDAITSAFSMHWVNDLPGMLTRMRRWLKPDGLLLLSMAGGVSFSGLRSCLAEAESQTAGGLSPRVLPMADIRDLGGLLGRAGFGLPVADSDTLTISWSDPFQMMRELRQMGESNALLGRANHMTRRDTLMKAATLYKDRFSTEDQRVKAEIELITLTAWAPSPDQQKPLKPGSADVNLADFLNANQDN